MGHTGCIETPRWHHTGGGWLDGPRLLGWREIRDGGGETWQTGAGIPNPSRYAGSSTA
jgi:hypothetical protein